jgi:ribosomal protein S18 acetylase RimI-like enzyme
MTPPTVGPVEDHEVDALASLMRHTILAIPYYNDEAKAVEVAKFNAYGLRALVAADPQAVLVSRDATALTGFCVSRYDDGPVWLTWFGTAEHARGRGVGAALLSALADTLPSRGAHKIWCDSRTENKESISVLERAGFTRIATLTNHWHGQDYFLWEFYPPASRPKD